MYCKIFLVVTSYDVQFVLNRLDGYVSPYGMNDFDTDAIQMGSKVFRKPACLIHDVNRIEEKKQAERAKKMFGTYSWKICIFFSRFERKTW